MIINAEDMILGRLATYAAKEALRGKDIFIVNCEKAVISGSKKMVLGKYQEKVRRGAPLRGPYFPRMPDKIVRRTIRGMLSYKKERGRKALSKIKCYISVPEELKNKKMETIKQAHISKTQSLKYVSVGRISHLLGAKV
ncbi:MAG: 50S ribosomal protein L13 [Nanoarchaeota archaeon]|nr:50S ribosomal protein L13 [Nanoarchaeota archaeon]